MKWTERLSKPPALTPEEEGFRRSWLESIGEAYGDTTKTQAISTILFELWQKRFGDPNSPQLASLQRYKSFLNRLGLVKT